jgi:hypothetical protein
LGAKTWMLVYASGDVGDALQKRPRLDRVATLEFAAKLFPKDRLQPIGDGDLSFTCPPDDEIHIGCFPGVSIVAAEEFGGDYPSKLPAAFIRAGGEGTVYLHAMHSVVDWFACAKWQDGQLLRALSLSPDSGVLEDIGERLPFEAPYWSGQYPVDDGDEDAKYPFPFHPLDLAEAALSHFFGYQLEGAMDGALIEPATIPLIKYRRTRRRWKLW